MPKAPPKGKKPGAKSTPSGRATPGRAGKSGARRSSAAKPQKLDIHRVLEGRTPIPANVDVLRGVHALPGSKNEIPFAAWCVRLGKLKLMELLAAEHPQLLREVGLNGSSVLHTAASKGPAFVTLLLQAGLDPALADHEGRLPVDMAIKAANKAVVRLLALPGDLDPLVLLDYPEFVRRVSAGEAPRLPTSALAAVLRRARLRVDLRDASGASRAAVARDAAPLVASLRELGARPTSAAMLDVSWFRSDELAAAYMQHGQMSAAERAEFTEALAASAPTGEPTGTPDRRRGAQNTV